MGLRLEKIYHPQLRGAPGSYQFPRLKGGMHLTLKTGHAEDGEVSRARDAGKPLACLDALTCWKQSLLDKALGSSVA